jgi:hypothetical protein
MNIYIANKFQHNMQGLTKLLVLGTSLIALTGCEPARITKTEYSPPMQEKGRVIENLHNDGYHNSSTDLAPTMDFDGNLGFATHTVTIDIPEKWGAVFRCEHDKKFAISGSSHRYKALWEKLDPGMDVVIDYREVYRTTYEDTNGDGERELTGKSLVDYDFLDANPVLEKE